jgi:GNAT superfamily N-acetyltransferase
MSLTIRRLRDTEVPLVLDSWTRTLEGKGIPMRMPGIGSGNYVRVGRDANLVAWAWYDVHRDWVQHTIPTIAVDVATLPGSDEALGWVAFATPADFPLVVHYVYTIGVARRRGVGAALLRHALAHQDDRGFRVSHTTPRGLHLLRATTRGHHGHEEKGQGRQEEGLLTP